MSRQLQDLNFGAGTPAPEWLNLDTSIRFRLPRLAHRILAGFRLSSFSPSFAENHYQYFQYRPGRRLPLSPNSVRWIYCSHVLEHLHSDEVLGLLDEFHRILMPTGVVRCVVPDLWQSMRDVVSQDPAVVDFSELLLTLPYAGRSHRLRAVNEALNGFPGCHKTMFLFENLSTGLSHNWTLSKRSGYLDSAIDRRLLSTVERVDACNEALVFELQPRYENQG